MRSRMSDGCAAHGRAFFPRLRTQALAEPADGQEAAGTPAGARPRGYIFPPARDFLSLLSHHNPLALPPPGVLPSLSLWFSIFLPRFPHYYPPFPFAFPLPLLPALPYRDPGLHLANIHGSPSLVSLPAPLLLLLLVGGWGQGVGGAAWLCFSLCSLQQSPEAPLAPDPAWGSPCSLVRSDQHLINSW